MVGGCGKPAEDSRGRHALQRDACPDGAVYCATKYAAWAITEGLRPEVDPSIRVTTTSPGAVESEIADSIPDPGTQEAIRALPETPITKSI
ncbi:SDR family NAD(P)-dependent oxidoreductase [Nonomuraea sp. K274]|uniref:SDR family NAD(P)-dependent oxidoreductase n=1 Tax=Nonomuraea cypriaca TaxID=1187855 RepID=A0A931A1Z1_9ACTN|nr:SDR family NAD(P)-dependent oxidoreductase [Nonomuraea cypriaca]